ncbi:MAG: tRNA pseudouridine(38-40) synthase TruA [Campylobacterota bacterium]|nr:tRNA pseudouridine(38-40) synthase TruA [Campylobacterota bacterium]
MRLKITISYNGRAFKGSQIQSSQNVDTVNGTVQKCLKLINIDAKVDASGRTDSGVHASAQVIHVDVPPHFSDTTKFKTLLNKMLPNTIKVKRVERVSSEFHSRFSAKSRVYRYFIKVGESNPFEDDFVTFVDALHVERINDAIRLFIGTHNFKFFKKNGSSTATDIRTITKAYMYKHKDYYIINLEANSFLRAQVRLIVGFLLKVSDGKLTKKELQEQLELKRVHNRHLAPASGLYLAKIKY